MTVEGDEDNQVVARDFLARLFSQLSDAEVELSFWSEDLGDADTPPPDHVDLALLAPTNAGYSSTYLQHYVENCVCIATALPFAQIPMRDVMLVAHALTRYEQRGGFSWQLSRMPFTMVCRALSSLLAAGGTARITDWDAEVSRLLAP